MDVVERYLAAVASQDWESFAECLSEEVRRVGPFGDVYEGKSAYLAFLRDLMPTLIDYSMDVRRVVYSGDVAVAELSETMAMGGSVVVTPESLVFDLADDGLIRHIAIYIQHSPR